MQRFNTTNRQPDNKKKNKKDKINMEHKIFKKKLMFQISSLNFRPNYQNDWE